MKKKIFMCGPNVIENEEHVLFMAKQLKSILKNVMLTFISKHHLIRLIDLQLHLIED